MGTFLKSFDSLPSHDDERAWCARAGKTPRFRLMPLDSHRAPRAEFRFPRPGTLAAGSGVNLPLNSWLPMLTQFFARLRTPVVSEGILKPDRQRSAPACQSNELLSPQAAFAIKVDSRSAGQT
jgi:hypothetical protein